LGHAIYCRVSIDDQSCARQERDLLARLVPANLSWALPSSQASRTGMRRELSTALSRKADWSTSHEGVSPKAHGSGAQRERHQVL